jgi:hypothetical protein
VARLTRGQEIAVVNLVVPETEHRNRPTERWQCDTDVGVGSTGTVAFSV